MIFCTNDIYCASFSDTIDQGSGTSSIEKKIHRLIILTCSLAKYGI